MFGFPLAAAQGMGGASSVVPKSSWHSRLFDRFNPGGADMSEADKSALIRQGLLGLAAGMAQTGGQGTAGAIGNGLQSGLLAMNKGREDVLDRKQRAQMLERGYGDPAGLREFEALTTAAGYAKGDEGYKSAARRRLGTEGRATSAGVGFETWTDANGVPRPAKLDPRGDGNYLVFYEESGQWIPLGAAASMPAGTPTLPAEDGSQMPVTQYGGGLAIGNDVPPQMRQQILAAETSGRTLPAYLSPESFTNVPAGLGRGRTKEAEAAAVADAQKRVELGALPAELKLRSDSAIDQAEAESDIRLQAAIEQARQEAGIKTGVERDTAQYEKDAGLRVYEAGMSGLTGALDETNTGPILGRVPAMTTGQQIAEGGVAAMAPILKQMFRASGEGVFTDKDQELLMRMVPTRKDTPEAREAKILIIDDIVRAKLNAPPREEPARESPPARKPMPPSKRTTRTNNDPLGIL